MEHAKFILIDVYIEPKNVAVSSKVALHVEMEEGLSPYLKIFIIFVIMISSCYLPSLLMHNNICNTYR